MIRPNKTSLKGPLRFLLIALFSASAWAQQPSAWSPEQEERYRSLISELRCLVCQNQTIADSSAPLAVDLRGQVQTQLAAGRSEDEIRSYLTDRYGDFVLYKPPLRLRTLALWIGPFALLGFALYAAYRFSRRSRLLMSDKPAAPSADALRRLLDEDNGRP